MLKVERSRGGGSRWLKLMNDRGLMVLLTWPDLPALVIGLIDLTGELTWIS